MTSKLQHRAIGAIIGGVHATGLDLLLSNRYSGIGSIFTFHRVRSTLGDFSPNAGLSVTPEFFEEVIKHIKKQNIDIMSMTEAHKRLVKSDQPKRFVVLSFDDGYRDNYENAFRICQKLRVPMVINVTTGFVDGTSFPWWDAIEEFVQHRERIIMPTKAGNRELDTSTLSAKTAAYSQLYKSLRAANRGIAANFLRKLERLNNTDFQEICQRLMVAWDMVYEMRDSGLVEFGAHTLTHPVLRTLSEADAEHEMAASRAVLAKRLGLPVEHFAYPFGSSADVGAREFALAKRVGFSTAVTTCHGTLQPEHKAQLHALPRLSINGFHQNLQTIEVFLSGATTALAHGLRRVAM